MSNQPKEHTMQTAKESARKLIDRLPDQATWEDIMYELYVKQKIEAGLKAVEEGRTIPHEEMKRRLLAKKRHA
jgi:predicted transcriptional regulator